MVTGHQGLMSELLEAWDAHLFNARDDSSLSGVYFFLSAPLVKKVIAHMKFALNKLVDSNESWDFVHVEDSAGAIYNRSLVNIAEARGTKVLDWAEIDSDDADQMIYYDSVEALRAVLQFRCECEHSFTLGEHRQYIASR